MQIILPNVMRIIRQLKLTHAFLAFSFLLNLIFKPSSAFTLVCKLQILALEISRTDVRYATFVNI